MFCTYKNKFIKISIITVGLKLVKDKLHHYFISLIQDMSINKYKSSLKEIAIKATSVFKKEGKVVWTTFN